jgi:hypothetical protein
MGKIFSFCLNLVVDIVLTLLMSCLLVKIFLFTFTCIAMVISVFLFSQKTGPLLSQSNWFVLALSAFFPAAMREDIHQIIHFMCEHVTRIQKTQNGGIMLILVDATVIILLAEGSPTEKMSSLISL